MERAIGLKSVANARELGGIKADGGVIRKGVLLRTGSLLSISEEDIEVLQTEYNLALVVDLRMNQETKQSPDPDISGADNLSLPVIEMEDYPNFDPELAKMLYDPNADRMELMKATYDMGMLDTDMYVDFLFTERGKEAYRVFFEHLIELPEGRSVLWHCTDGKDRTGVAAMLVLTALGVSGEDILQDYMLTNEYNKYRIDKAKPAIDSAPFPPELRELMYFGAGAVYEIYMTSALDAMTDRCGSAEGYLSEMLGVGADEVRVLKDKFLV